MARNVFLYFRDNLGLVSILLAAAGVEIVFQRGAFWQNKKGDKRVIQPLPTWRGLILQTSDIHRVLQAGNL